MPDDDHVSAVPQAEERPRADRQDRDPGTGAGGGERAGHERQQYGQQQARLTLRRHAGESVVWVAHGDVVIIATLWGRGMPLTELSNYKGANYIGHASVTKFVFEPGRDLPVSVEYVDPNKETR